MRKERIRRSGPHLAVLLLCLALLPVLFSSAQAAEVAFTEEGGGAADAIYVAGNPDLYPVEYYNKDTGAYEGLMPELLRQVSEQTGLSFTYIYAGEEDQQTHLARNRQVDLLTAYVPSGRVEGVVSTVPVFTVTLDGVEISVCIAFTDVASAPVRERLSAVLHSVGKNETAGAAVSYIRSHTAPVTRWNVARVLCIVLAAAFLSALLWALHLRRRKNQAEAEHLLDTTGLGNKEFFLRQFDRTISEQNRHLCYLAHLAFDVDWTNEAFGAAETDRILADAARIIEKQLDRTSFASRVSGGAFAMVFQADNPDAAGEQVDRLLAALQEVWAGRILSGRIQFRAGIYPLSGGRVSGDEALSGARQAYQQAVSSKSNYVFASLGAKPAAGPETDLHAQMHSALERGEFVPYFQCTVNTATNQVCGGEILSRWLNPRNGLQMPGTYVPVLEKLGLVNELDYHMFECACRQLEQWSGTEYGSLYISCNFTRITLSHEDCVSRIREIVQRYHFTRSNLIVEVTEDAMEEDREAARRTILACRELGFRISIDDFGSGYTSFLNLYEYPIDLVKVDKALVDNVVESEKGARLLNGLVSMAHAMKMSVLCEGVDNEEKDRIVRSSRCDVIQGFFYARVLPLEEVPRFLKRRRGLSS